MIYLKYFKYIILFFASLLFYFFIKQIGLNGHDSFQYIEWSNKIFTDPNFTFNRQVLYIYIYIINSILKWPYFGLGISNLLAFVISSLIIFKIYEIFQFKEITKILSFLTFLCSSLVINSFTHNYISNIETLFLLTLFYFSLLLFEKKEKKIIFICHGIFSSLIFFIHEEKIIISFLIYFFILIFLEKKNYIIYSFLSFLITKLSFFIFFWGEISIIDYFRVTASAISKDNYLIFNNFILNLIYSFKVNFGYLTNIFLPISIYILLFKKEFKIKLYFKFILFVALGYLIILTPLVGHSENLARTYGVCFILVNFFIFYLIEEYIYNYPKYKIVTYCLIFIFLIPFTLNFYKTFFKKNYKNKYILTYQYLTKNFKEKDIFLLELPSFENRRDMWNENQIYGYGLSSVVYLGNRSINLDALKFKTKKKDNQILTELNNFNQIVFHKKNDPDVIEAKIIKELNYSNNWRKNEISKNLVIFNKIIN